MSEGSPRRDFLHGLRTPSVPALASASATVMALGALCVVTIRPSWLADGRVRWLASGPDDDYAFATAMAHGLTAGPGAVILLGGSGTRESFTSEADLEERLGGRDVVDLTTDAQTIIESAGLLERLPDLAGRRVVVGISPHRVEPSIDDLRVVAEQPRLGFDSPVIDEELGRLGFPARARTGWPFLDHRDFWVLRLPYLPLNLLRLGVDKQQHRYHHRSPLSEAELGADWPGQRARVEANGRLHLDALERLVARVRAQQGSVVLLTAPSWRDWSADPAEQAYYDAYDRLTADFAARTGLDLWTLDREAALTHADFRDPAHLNNHAAQERYTAVLASRLDD